MIRIAVRLYARLADMLGSNEVRMIVNEGSSVRDLLRGLGENYGLQFRKALFSDDGEVLSPINILLNGANVVFLKGLDTRLRDEDRVFIFLPVSGG